MKTNLLYRLQESSTQRRAGKAYAHKTSLSLGTFKDVACLLIALLLGPRYVGGYLSRGAAPHA